MGMRARRGEARGTYPQCKLKKMTSYGAFLRNTLNIFARAFGARNKHT